MESREFFLDVESSERYSGWEEVTLMYLLKIKEATRTCKRATASSFVKVAGTRTTRLGRTRENTES